MLWHSGDMLGAATRFRATAIGFTSNAVLRINGNLVMGGGAALRVRDAFPHIDEILGKKLGVGPAVVPDYHICAAEIYNGALDPVTIVAIQTVRDFSRRDTRDSMWNLMDESLKKLAEWWQEAGEPVMVINCPGIGLAGFGNEKQKVIDLVEERLGETNIYVCLI